jgi:SnoaL-like domain
MSILKRRKAQVRARVAESADSGRRSFIRRVGAGVSGALASTAVGARVEAGDTDDLSLKVALLEDEKSLRRLHQNFEQALDEGRYEDALDVFADDARVLFNGGVFADRSRGVSRLFLERFRAGRTGKRMEPAPGFAPDADPRQDEVEVAPDRLSAMAVFPYSIQVGTPIESDTSLVSMARLHGEGVRTWWEGGFYKVVYARDAADGGWRIRRLEYDTQSRADYRPGRSYASAITVPPLTDKYPQDRQGPDALV